MHPVTRSVALSICLFGSISAYAAKSIDLGKQPVSLLKNYVAVPTSLRSAAVRSDEMKEVRRDTDSSQNTHIRMQQYHAGYPVWGADSVMHVPASHKNAASNFAMLASSPASTMNGRMYQELDADLVGASPQVFNDAQAEKAKNKAIELVRGKYGMAAAEVNKQQLMVYVDQQNKAHWAFLISVYLPVTGANEIPAKPVYILDANSFEILKTWNDMKTMQHVNGGGYGGNLKVGKVVYDGLTGDLAALSIARDDKNICHMENEDVMVFDARKGTNKNAKDIVFNCNDQDGKHNNVYWNTLDDSANGGYAPSDDALYAGTVVQSLYKQWYNMPMLVTKGGKPMLLRMYSHYGKQWENAEWDDSRNEIHLGDGADWAYPLTSIGVIAHEVSHGFTSQHSNLVYADQSGSLNESFSDMAAQAAEAFALGKSSWQIGPEIVKQENTALRYMDQPSKDCQKDASAGSDCSIDSADQYDHLVKFGRDQLHLYGDDLEGYVVHLASGVFNRAFYLLATSDGWDTKKAFGVMIHANSYYWTQTSDFHDAACGVVKSANEMKYDAAAVKEAFKKVGIDTTSC